MDDAAKLVEELHDRLVELNTKIAAYRCGMLAEFQRRMDKCLEGYPGEVSREVSRAIDESLSSGRYSDLSPASRDVQDLPALNHKAWEGRKSPPPVLRHTSGTPKEPAPRSPHAREKEFQGLFTPTYLPLLERNDSAYRSPPMSPQASPAGPPPAGPSPAGPSPAGSSLAPSTHDANKVDEPKQTPSPGHEDRPSPARQLTDQSTSSNESSGGDSAKVRKSALRQSSVSSKGSPRRVHFKVEGEDVFPASSSPQATTPTPVSESGVRSQLKAEAPPPIATKGESTTLTYVGTSLLDVEGEEDSLPRPKKVSSTQALQALTRSPLEEGSTWTVVNPDPEPAGAVKMNGKKPQQGPAELGSQTTIRADVVEDEIGNGPLGSLIEELTVDGEDENVSDEEFLSMRPKGKSPSPVAQTPFALPPAQTANALAPLLNGNPSPGDGEHDHDHDHDALFDFEDEGEGECDLSPSTPNPRRQPPKYLPEPDDDDTDEIAAASRRPVRAAPPNQTAADGSPPSPLSPSPSSTTVTAKQRSPASPPSSVLFGHSIGSYMGRPVATAPIKDAKLYDAIADMKDVHFFVGSIDGRSGPEPADLGSYRAASLAAAGGSKIAAGPRGVGRGVGGGVGGGFVPRSFSERLALEEEMERRAAQAEAEAEAAAREGKGDKRGGG